MICHLFVLTPVYFVTWMICHLFVLTPGCLVMCNATVNLNMGRVVFGDFPSRICEAIHESHTFSIDISHGLL